jgi:hypothetical protein
MHCKLWLCAAACPALVGCASNTPPTGYYITPDEMQQVYGTYALSNGDILRITREHNRYWADMPLTGRIEIVPVASIAFVDKAGQLRYTFTQGAFDTDVHIAGYAAQGGPAVALNSAP